MWVYHDWGCEMITPSRRKILGSWWMYHEGKQAQFGLRLPISGPETPTKTVRFRNLEIRALISPCLSKYGLNGLEKRRSPRPFKLRLVFYGGLPVWGEICPAKGRYRGHFFRAGLKNKVICPIFLSWWGEIWHSLDLFFLPRGLPM